MNQDDTLDDSDYEDECVDVYMTTRIHRRNFGRSDDGCVLSGNGSRK